MIITHEERVIDEMEFGNGFVEFAELGVLVSGHHVSYCNPEATMPVVWTIYTGQPFTTHLSMAVLQGYGVDIANVEITYTNGTGEEDE